MHPRRKGEGLTVPALAASIARAAVRTLDLGGRVAKMDSGLAGHSPVLAVLGTDGDAPRDWLRAGQALERLPLVAVRAGIQASYLNQPVQTSHLRPKLAELLSTPGSPQIVMCRRRRGARWLT